MVKNKHKQYMKAFALHNSHRYTDGGRLHLFSDLLFWLPHQINSLNNSRCDCGGGRLFRVGCHVGVEPQAWVCSKDGNVCYVCLLVRYNFSRSKDVTVLLKCIFLSCWYHSGVVELFGWLPGKFWKNPYQNPRGMCTRWQIMWLFTTEMLEHNVFTCSEEVGRDSCLSFY